MVPGLFSSKEESSLTLKIQQRILEKKLAMIVSSVRTLLITVFLGLSLTGCFEKKEEIHDVQWYLEHQEEKEALLKKCNKNPGTLMDTQNCKNAAEADLNPF